MPNHRLNEFIVRKANRLRDRGVPVLVVAASLGVCGKTVSKYTSPGKPGPRPKPAEAHFWGYVRKTRGCWHWTGNKSRKGYGTLTIHSLRKTVVASRLSWEIHIGAIPEGMLVLHKCDNPACVNPKHLFLGTQQDNSSDMVAKGRQARHDRHHFSKLTMKSVRTIRHLYAAGRHSQQALAEMNGVTSQTISRIVNCRIWRE